MKKTFLLTFIFFFIVLSSPVFAQTKIPIPTTTTTPTPTPYMIDYPLPYPGILPGSPLYSLKMLRDRITELLISDPLKKSNFYLLQADKRVASTVMLVEKGEINLAQSTLSKGQNYLEKSFQKAKEAKGSGADIKEIYSRIKNSAAKQRQEIEQLSKKSKEAKKSLSGDLERVKKFEKLVERLKP